jgi:hypothetical protein
MPVLLLLLILVAGVVAGLLLDPRPALLATVVVWAVGGRAGWRAWTRGGDPVAIGGLCWWRRRLDAAGALAWVAPASGARCLALAAHVRALDDFQLNDLLVELPTDRFDALLDAAFPLAKGVAA